MAVTATAAATTATLGGQIWMGHPIQKIGKRRGSIAALMQTSADKLMRQNLLRLVQYLAPNLPLAAARQWKKATQKSSLEWSLSRPDEAAPPPPAPPPFSQRSMAALTAAAAPTSPE